MKRILILFFVLIFFIAGCGGSSDSGSGDSNSKPDNNTPVNPSEPSDNNPVKSSEKSIGEYSFLASHNSGITEDIHGVISGINITLNIPATADISGLVADFKASDNAVVMTSAGIQSSGISPNNFNAPVIYYVKAQDGSIAIYTVTVIPDNSTIVSGWPKSFGGSLADEARDIARDDSGNVFVAGHFRESVDFDPGPNKDIKNSYGSADVFVSKFHSDGSYAWTKTIGGSSEDRSYAIKTDKQGSIIITGYFNGSVNFNPQGVADLKVAEGTNDIFITKFNPDGSYAWTKTHANNSYANSSVAIDSSNNIYVAGSFSGTVDFDPEGNHDTKTSIGTSIFITKLNQDGSYAWTKTYKNNTSSESSIFIDSSENILLTGSFSGTADFEPEGNHDYHVSAGSTDIFIAKFSIEGSKTWIKTIGGAGADNANKVISDSDNNVYITGSFSKTVDFNPEDSSDIKNDSSSNGYTGDAFITKLNQDGSYAWTKTMGGAYTDTGISIAITGDGNIVITGSFVGTADFNPEGNHDYFTSAGNITSTNSDIFITYFSPAGEYIRTRIFGGPQEDAPKSMINGFITGYFSDSVDFGLESPDIKVSQGFKDIFVSVID